MDLTLGADQQVLQDEVRAWLVDHAPRELPAGLEARFERLRAWQAELYEAGWLGFGWPEQHGGRGGTILDQLLITQELVRSRAPMPVGLVSLEVVGPTLLAHGTPEQLARYVRPLLRGDDVWCQGFSEPEAGSDLAALRTRADITETGFVVTGQKVWTSWAQFSQRCAVLARTDPDAAPHRGISYLLVDMDAPGVEVRPIRQLTGDPEFSEVFLDNVPVPRDGILGELHDGWTVAMSTLTFERGPYAVRRLAEIRVSLQQLAEEAARPREDGTRPADDPSIQTRLGYCAALVGVMEARGYQTLGRIMSGDLGPESSMDKLFLPIVEQAVTGLAYDLLGDLRLAPDAALGGDGARRYQDYLYGRASSIYGGTAQIQRDIIARRVLGLPRG